jgi:serine/threonine protein kinase
MRVQGVRMDGSSASDQLGKYRLVARLGQGGMGTVYLALASGLGQFRKVLVVKELRQDLTRVQGFVRMFMDEAKLAARLHHPNVVQTFEASQEGERYYLAMEYLDGQPLSALIDRLSTTRELPLWVHIQILCEVLAGLHYAHRLPDYDGSSLEVVHRDVSPQNVFLTYHGQVKLVDFGVAKAADATTSTDPGVFKGKFAYAGPEQILGRPVDARSDVFAVGIMLWEAIAGQRFSGQQPTPAAFRARAEGREPRIRDVVPLCDRTLAEICDRALAIDPDERFASADALRLALQAFLHAAGVRVEAPEIGQLMRDAFHDERRAIHLQIERAMNHDTTGDLELDTLPFLHHGEGAEKEVTAHADLSSLVDVSLQHDDDKIRDGYAQSMISALRPQGSGPLVPGERISRGWLIASTALSGLCLITLTWLVLARTDPAPAVSPALPPRAASARLSDPRAPVQPVVAVVEPQPELEQEPAPEADEPAQEPGTVSVGEARVSPAQAQPVKPVRTRSTAARPVVVSDVAVAAPAAQPAPEPKVAAVAAVQPAPVELKMDADLRPARRVVAPIDTEDPYR